MKQVKYYLAFVPKGFIKIRSERQGFIQVASVQHDGILKCDKICVLYFCTEVLNSRDIWYTWLHGRSNVEEENNTEETMEDISNNDLLIFTHATENQMNYCHAMLLVNNFKALHWLWMVCPTHPTTMKLSTSDPLKSWSDRRGLTAPVRKVIKNISSNSGFSGKVTLQFYYI